MCRFKRPTSISLDNEGLDNDQNEMTDKLRGLIRKSSVLQPNLTSAKSKTIRRFQFQVYVFLERPSFERPMAVAYHSIM